MIEINERNTISFTGHREFSHSPDIIEQLVEDIVLTYIERGYDTFLCGMAVGFDLLAGKVVLKLKEQFNDIKLVLCIPCDNQDNRYSFNDKKLYRFLLQKADDARYVSREYSVGCMLKRDRFMVDNSNLVIAYQVSYTGGTAYTTSYARQCCKKVVNIVNYVANV